MSLGGYKAIAGLSVPDMERAREFYKGKLGLSVAIDPGGSWKDRTRSSQKRAFHTLGRMGKRRASRACGRTIQGIQHVLAGRLIAARGRQEGPRRKRKERR